ncbi:hypothetical protein [Parachryseolinea silvisoli]|uniref:hypothetical protein n=1 Tax=Parachryseolinea silvisoli TaxID=2873601 RepID=UPI002265DC26|nr:hypothetical protein [Parachryseolinea silvisoli]MCD9017510.1 hypothetical protein [Parachryseolinea silvisoli]
MNYILHLNTWMGNFGDDQRLRMQHYALYMALFFEWNQARFRTPIMIKRAEVMRNAGIGSVNFYIRTIKELSEWGYICYEPSFHPAKGSSVHMRRFDTGGDKADDNGNGQADDNGCDNDTNNGVESNSVRDKGGGNGAGNASDYGHSNATDNGIITDQGGDKGGGNGRGNAGDNARETLYINNTNSTNNANSINGLNEYGTSNENSNFVNDRVADANPQATGTGNHHRQKQTAGAGGRGGRETASTPSAIQEAQEYFTEQLSTAAEAEKFFDHYQAVGWVIGRAPIKDWRAAARKWIKNAKNFNHANNNTQPIPGPLNTGPKSYSKPF